MIETLHFYKLDKNKNSYDVTSEFVKYIQSVSNKNDKINSLFEEISNNFYIPVKILRQKFSQLIFRSFDFKHNKFKHLNLINMIFDCLKFYSLIFIAILGHVCLRFKKIKKKKF